MRLPMGLAARLTAAFLLVTVVAVGSVAVLARRSSGQDFHAYVVGQMAGRSASMAGAPAQAPVPGPAPGRGQAGAGGLMRGPAAMVASAEDEFLRRLDGSLLTAAAIAGVAALLVGLAATRHLTQPLEALRAAAHRMEQGDLTARVAVSGSAEIAEVARTFNQMAESLQRQETMRRSLVADVAHDLRTPVTVIQGTIDALIDGVYAPSTEHLVSIREETERLAQLVRDLRDVSLAESGQLRLDRHATDLAHLAERALRRIESAAAAQGVGLRSAVALPGPTVHVDPARIEQVLDNLLTNALRYTPPGGEIAIHLERPPVRQDGGAEVTLTVTDTGSGIAPDDLPRVFDRFYRADPARTRGAHGAAGAAGSGLGLAIVKAIAEEHGGHVSAASVPGHGSRFTVALPAA